MRMSFFFVFFFFSSRRRHTRCGRDWSSDVCSSDLTPSTSSVTATPASRCGSRLPAAKSALRVARVGRPRASTTSGSASNSSSAAISSRRGASGCGSSSTTITTPSSRPARPPSSQSSTTIAARRSHGPGATCSRLTATTSAAPGRSSARLPFMVIVPDCAGQAQESIFGANLCVVFGADLFRRVTPKKCQGRPRWAVGSRTFWCSSGSSSCSSRSWCASTLTRGSRRRRSTSTRSRSRPAPRPTSTGPSSERSPPSSRTAVWDSFEVTKDLGDGGVIEVIQERIALDRVSAESRNCCGDRPRHEGLTLKFPFNTRKTGYSFWDSRAQQAFPATFVGEEKVRGVKVYRFEQHFSGVPLDTIQVSGVQAGQPKRLTVPATLVYGNDRTLWVEPRSGVIVKAAENQTQILQTADGHPVLTGFRGQLAWDDATVRENADDASSAASQLRLIQTILPIVALALGVVLVVLGVALVARQPSRPANEPAPETRPADAL